MISKKFQILSLQPRISKVLSQSLEQFFHKVGQNNFGNKIPKNACMSEITLIYTPGMYLNSRKETWL